MVRIAGFTMPDPVDGRAIVFPSYEVPETALCVITGPNGSGKSTFMRYLRDHPELVQTERRGGIIMLDQMYEPLLYPYKPVWWNVSLPRILENSHDSPKARKLALEKLAEFNLEVDADMYPCELSGGEKHLVLLLRMALCPHDILLLDEPATGVDASRVDRLWDMVTHLSSVLRKTVILSTHRDYPHWHRQDPLVFTGIRGQRLCIETFIPKEMHHETETSQ